MTKLLLLFSLPFFGSRQTVQVLVALGCSAPAYMQNQYRQMLIRDVLPDLDRALMSQPLTLILAPITSRSYTAPIKVFQTPNPLTTPFFALERYRVSFNQRVLRGFNQLSQWASADCIPGSEIIAALKAAGQRVKGPGEILVLSHGFEQSTLMNLYDYYLNLQSPRVRARLLEKVKTAIGLPDLKGQEVCFAGLTSGSGSEASARLTSALELFWNQLIEASGGRLVGYSYSPQLCGFL
jgi:hypothetical protein